MTKVSVEFTYDDIRDFIKSCDSDFANNANIVLSFSLLFFSLGFSQFIPTTELIPTLGILASIIEVKNEIIGVGRRILGRIASDQQENYLSRYERMNAAYYLLCYIAFFEALDNEGNEIATLVGMQPSEKLWLIQLVERRLTQPNQDIGEVSLEGFNTQLPTIQLPHPVDEFQATYQQLAPIYQKMAEGLLNFIKSLDVWDEADETRAAAIQELINRLPNHAFNYFKSMYFDLSTEFNEFFIWGNLHNQQKSIEALKQTESNTESLLTILHANQEKIDVGFRELKKITEAIPDDIEQRQADRLLGELDNIYSANIDAPVIKENIEIPDEIGLRYPKKSEIFVPQAFKVIRFTGKGSLEDEATWRTIPERNDLGTFLFSYVTSPYSVDNPLIILGYPGSGKSLLTMFIAKTFSSRFTTFRIELRNINADGEIAAQIEDQLESDTHRRVSWADLRLKFAKRPSLVLFDGYDELLQASGKVYSGYIEKVKEFQQRELTVGQHPVRTVITSRVTLIGEAKIPRGATIVRLQEFDAARTERWISTWNNSNQNYFRESGIKPFTLPANDKVSDLAKQPLLLLILALYDSQNNDLRNQQNLNRTMLYNNLIRDFIKREVRKNPESRRAQEADFEAEIDKDMERLGVAAIGMFNRRRLNIKSVELENDIVFFDVKKPVPPSDGRKLSQADLLLGSFFFVFESQTTTINENSALESNKHESAFEFLHNTFGEFLTAEFIVRKILKNITWVVKSLEDNVFEQRMRESLENPDGLPNEWFAPLIYTHLFSRPVILDMIKEWLEHKFGNKRIITRDSFLKGFDLLIENQIKHLFTKNLFPSIMREDLGRVPFVSLPLLGHIAIYTLNLITLRTVCATDQYIFEEKRTSSYEDSARVWDRITYLWRSWFSIETLYGLTAIIEAKRNDDKIMLKAKPEFGLFLTRDRLEKIISISLALADDIMWSLAKFTIYDPYNTQDISELHQRFTSEEIDLHEEVLSQKLRKLKWNSETQDFDRTTVEQIFEVIRSDLMGRHYSHAHISLFDELIKAVRLSRDQDLHNNLYKLVARIHSETHPDAIANVMLFALESGADDFIRGFGFKLFKERVHDLSPKLLEIMVTISRRLRDYRLLHRIYDEYRYQARSGQIDQKVLIDLIDIAVEFSDTEFFNHLHNELEHNILRSDDVYFIEKLLSTSVKIRDESLISYGSELLNSKIDTSNFIQMPKKELMMLSSLADRFHVVKFLDRLIVEFNRWSGDTQKSFTNDYSSANYASTEIIVNSLRLAYVINHQIYVDFAYSQYLPQVIEFPYEIALKLSQLATEFNDYSRFEQLFTNLLKLHRALDIKFNLILAFLRTAHGYSRDEYIFDALIPYIEELISFSGNLGEPVYIPYRYSKDLIDETINYAYATNKRDFISNILKSITRLDNNTTTELLIKFLEKAMEYDDYESVRRMYDDVLRGQKKYSMVNLYEGITARAADYLRDETYLSYFTKTYFSNQNRTRSYRAFSISKFSEPLEFAIDLATTLKDKEFIELALANVIGLESGESLLNITTTLKLYGAIRELGLVGYRELYRAQIRRFSPEKCPMKVATEYITVAQAEGDILTVERYYRYFVSHIDYETWDTSLATKIVELSEDFQDTRLQRSYYEYLRQNLKLLDDSLKLGGLYNVLRQKYENFGYDRR